MLDEFDAMATLAVADLTRSRAFYERVLGLVPAAVPEPHMAAYRTGASTLMVYESEFAGTNRATSATWTVRGLPALVQALQARGAVFEQYDMPGTVREGAVHRGGGRSVAWCKDPDGNILCLAEG